MTFNQEIKTALTNTLNEVIEKAHLKEHDIFVLGCSSSEVMGATIGEGTNQEMGELIVATCLDVLTPLQIHLAVQGCEHINRALTIERKIAKTLPFEQVTVKPVITAGGAAATAAFKLMDDPVELEHIVAKGGLDIGDTSIGMHIKHVQIPIKLSNRTLGSAHLSALGTRPKLVGGPRANYPF